MNVLLFLLHLRRWKETWYLPTSLSLVCHALTSVWSFMDSGNRFRNEVTNIIVESRN